MSILWLRKPVVSCLAVVLALVMFAVPMSVIAQDTATACMDAERQAAADTNGTLWFGLGCLTTWVGWLLANVLDATPPATSLLGKSPEYVAVYTDCYKNKAKKLRSKSALTGCLITAGVYVIYYVIVIAAVSSADEV